jgi:hypothetical protein
MFSKLCLFANNRAMYVSSLRTVGLVWLCLAMVVKSSVTEDPDPGEYLIDPDNLIPMITGRHKHLDSHISSLVVKHCHFRRLLISS